MPDNYSLKCSLLDYDLFHWFWIDFSDVFGTFKFLFSPIKCVFQKVPHYHLLLISHSHQINFHFVLSMIHFHARIDLNILSSTCYLNRIYSFWWPFLVDTRWMILPKSFFRLSIIKCLWADVSFAPGCIMIKISFTWIAVMFWMKTIDLRNHSHW